MVPKLNRLKVAEILKSTGLTLFTPQEFAGLFKVSFNTASTFIKRNVNSGLFIKLRNKFYVLNDTIPSHFFVANKLYQPSYISLETALSHYGVIPEIVYTITSVTTKPTREFTTPIGAFSYQRIKQQAYCGYQSVQLHGSTVFLAEPEKALVDYLYFVDIRRSTFNDRIFLKKINRRKLIAYARIFERPNLLKIIAAVYAEQRKPRTIY